MQKQTINFNTPEAEFILCRNVSGATVSLGAPVYFDTAAVTDGFAVSGARTGQKYLFAGITTQIMASNSNAQSAKQLVQRYGIGSAYVHRNAARRGELCCVSHELPPYRGFKRYGC